MSLTKFCCLFLFVLLVFEIHVGFTSLNLRSYRRGKLREIGDCDIGGIDRIGCSMGILLEYLSNLVCCSCGSAGAPIKTPYAKCYCKNGETGAPEISDYTGVKWQEEGKLYEECFLNDSYIDEAFMKSCCEKGRDGCSRVLDDRAAEILVSDGICVDEAKRL